MNVAFCPQRTVSPYLNFGRVKEYFLYFCYNFKISVCPAVTIRPSHALQEVQVSNYRNS